jgi:hypothetical protein
MAAYNVACGVLPPGLVHNPWDSIAVINSRERMGSPDFWRTAAAASRALSRLGLASFFFAAFAGLVAFAFVDRLTFAPLIRFFDPLFFVFAAIIHLLCKGTAAPTRRGVVHQSS